MFKVGQKVVFDAEGDSVFGKVLVIHNDGGKFPIVVAVTHRSDSGHDIGDIETFTEDGRPFIGGNVTLKGLDALPQDFLSELKALLEKYNASIEVNFDRGGDQEVEIAIDGKPTYRVDGSILDLDTIAEMRKKV